MRRRLLASVGGKPLPYDAEVEYLDSLNVEAYIDTDYIPNKDTNIEIKFCPVNFTKLAVACAPYGSRDGYRNNEFSLMCPVNSVGHVELMCGNGINASRDGSTLIGKVMTFLLLGRHATIEDQNGNIIMEKELPNRTQSVVARYGLRFFSTNQINNVPGITADATNITRIYRASVFETMDGSDPIHDYICVRKNGHGAFYDRVTGNLLFNARAGYEFGIGPDVVSTRGGY